VAGVIIWRIERRRTCDKVGEPAFYFGGLRVILLFEGCREGKFFSGMHIKLDLILAVYSESVAVTIGGASGEKYILCRELLRAAMKHCSSCQLV